jgi:hypothetical protein
MNPQHEVLGLAFETMAGGVAAFDYNGDGLTDVFFTNGAALPSLTKDSPKYWNRLFRNDGRMRFIDVTEEVGVAGQGYSMGAAAADYDNDGDVDLFVAGVNRNILYHNLGNGRFEDVSEKVGLSKYQGRGMSLAFADYDADGFMDVFITNDNQANFLFHNRGDSTFEEVGMAAGMGLLNSGQPVSSMAVDFRPTLTSTTTSSNSRPSTIGSPTASSPIWATGLSGTLAPSRARISSFPGPTAAAPLQTSTTTARSTR